MHELGRVPGASAGRKEPRVVAERCMPCAGGPGRPCGGCLAWECRAVSMSEALIPRCVVFDGLDYTACHWEGSCFGGVYSVHLD